MIRPVPTFTSREDGHATDGAAAGGTADAIRGSLRWLEAKKAHAGGSRTDSGRLRPDVSPLHQTVRRRGYEALLDKRISQASHRLAPVDEVMALAERCQGTCYLRS